jgi:hypothetical protein
MAPLGLARWQAGGNRKASLSSGDIVEDLRLRIPQSGVVGRRLERECQGNVELVWTTGA